MHSNASDEKFPYLKDRFATPPDVPPQDDEGDEGTHVKTGRGRQVPGLDFEWPDGTRKGFQYVQMGLRTYEPQKIVIRVDDFEQMEAVIKGRNLLPLADLIQEQRCSKIRVSARDMGPDDAMTVTSITFEAVKAED